MSMHLLYHPDGSIYSCNQVYDDPRKFENGLADLGIAGLTYESIPGLISGDDWYVDVAAQETIMRPPMDITVTKTVIRCGPEDSAIFRGMPKQSKVTVRWMSEVVYPEFVLDAEELEISIPVPAVYHVEIKCWPYKTYIQEIRAEV